MSCYCQTRWQSLYIVFSASKVTSCSSVNRTCQVVVNGMLRQQGDNTLIKYQSYHAIVKQDQSQNHRTPPFEASRRLFIKWRWWQKWNYQKGRFSLRAQGTKRQVIFHWAYACPKINHVMLWNKVTVTGSLASLSMICLASSILCQLVCHLLLLCGSVVNLLLCKVW